MKPAILFLILGMTVSPLPAQAQDRASLEQIRAAAERGDTDAQRELGVLYEFGFNMPKNNVNALAWYLRAAERGDVFAARRRDVIQSGMSPEEIEAARTLSRELAAKAPSGAGVVPPTPADDRPSPPP